MNEERRITRRIRKQVDEQGLRMSIAADLNAVVATGPAAASSSSQHVRVRQDRSSRAGADPDPKEQS